jgi:hypothetical protein
MLYETSQRIAKYCKGLVAEQAEKARQKKRATDLADSIVDDEMRTSDKGKAAARILALLVRADGGRLKWSGADGAQQRKFSGDDRRHADEGLKWLIDEQKVRTRTQGRTVYIELVDDDA